MSFSLTLLGRTSLEGPRGPVTGPAVQRHRLALLALLAVSRPGALTRSKLKALLWPERDAAHARCLLNQSVHVLRRTLGDEALISAGDELRLEPRVIRCDAVVFEEAFAAGDLERAIAIYSGPLLDGFFLPGAWEFDQWVDRERQRLADARATAVEAIAERAERSGDLRAAGEWWKSLAAHDPYDSRVALRLMEVLEAGGNRAGAVQHAAAHAQLLREDLEVDPPPQVAALSARLSSREAVPRDPESRRSVPVRRGSRLVAVPLAGGPPARPERRARYAVGLGLAALLLGLVSFGSTRLALRAPGVIPPTTPSPASIVDDVARAVAEERDRRIRGDTAVRLPQHRTHSIAAYELYLRGREPTIIRQESGARQALEYFQRAIVFDSTYAAPYAGAARVYLRFLSFREAELPRADLLALSEGAALRAIEIGAAGPSLMGPLFGELLINRCATK